MRRIGLLSDTHGHLDPKVHRYLETVDEVWHAGDIGENSVLEGLRERYSLRAVSGNIDSERIRREVPEDQRFEAEGVKVWMTHIGGRPGKYPARIREGFRKERPDIFVCGHSHILKVEYDEREGILYMNPGAIGNEGFHRVKTFLRFELEGGEPRNMEAIELGKRGSG
jgi:putative phosphoesterase